MATTAQYLEQLQADKQTLVDNLVAKGIEVSNDETFTSLAPKVADIQSGEVYTPEYISFQSYQGTSLENALKNIDTSNITSMSKLFYDCANIVSIDLSNIDATNVTSTSYMFNSCRKLKNVIFPKKGFPNVTDISYMFHNGPLIKKINIEPFNSGKLKNMKYLFNYCRYTEEIIIGNCDTSTVTNMSYLFSDVGTLTSGAKCDLENLKTNSVTTMEDMFDSSNLLEYSFENYPNFVTNNVTSMSSMFDSNKSITELNLSSFNTSNVTSFTFMFRSCSNLTSLDLSSFTIEKCTGISAFQDMFNGCKSLRHLDIRSMEFTDTVKPQANTFTNVPVDCEIIVKDDTVRNIVLSVVPTLTNIKTVAELV